MNRNGWLSFAVCFFLLPGCASWQQAGTGKSSRDAAQIPGLISAPADAAPAPKPKSAAIPLPPKSNVRAVKSADGTINGEIVGIPAPSSKFTKLQIGMTLAQVESLIGQPEDTDSSVTGKQFQPFHLGGDTQRMDYFYKHEGRLTFFNVQIDGAADTLIRIVVDPNISVNR